MTTSPKSLVTAESVTGTIDAFTSLDKSGDKDSMNDLARRLGKEQPSLLQYAAALRTDHGDQVGEAAVFYATLMWAMFDRAHGKQLHQLSPQNLADAAKLVEEELGALGDKEVHERLPASLVARQPDLMKKLGELIAEDVKEAALTADSAGLIMKPTLTVIEAFDAALTGRRPGKLLGPVVRSAPKVGRNDVCPCGSGKKYKRCHALLEA
jgi:hypothetical protein